MRRESLVVLGVAMALAFAGSAHAAPIPGQYIVVLKPGADEAATAADHGRAGAEVFEHYRHALNGYAARMSPQTLQRVRADQRVEFVEADREVSMDAQSLPTGIDRIDSELSTARTSNRAAAASVNVAVIDTGSGPHSDLNVVGGKNCSTGKSYNDGNGHGTHVAGTIAAKDDTGGVVGVVPGARIWSVRVLNNAGSGSTSSVICGIDWVTSTRTDGNTSNDIKVANMSLGGSGSDSGGCSNGDAEHRAICRSVAAGVTYAVAAGNDGADFRSSAPAAYDEVLTVTAVADFNGQPGGGGSPTCRADVDDTAADFSNYATLAGDQAHTIAAPGVCILSTWKGGGYNTISGTSMAAPHETGVAALCVATGACAGLTPAQIIQKLRSDAAARPSSFGFGGDPFAPIAGRYYGYLTTAGVY